jgi:hypothetical protein
VRAVAGGDFSPNHHVVVRFDSLILAEGREVPIRSHVTGAAGRLTLSIAATTAEPSADQESSGVAARTRETVRDAKKEATEKARDALAAIKKPGRMDRLKTALIDRLPYHPDALAKGLVYTVDLEAPLEFGQAPATPAAPAGALPAPESILNARLVTPLDSSTSPRGTPVEAVLTEPVFSAEHDLVLPEGSRLTGEVTVSRTARRFHRGGQLRFLIESVQPPSQDASRLLASLYSVQVDAARAVEVDEEGGARASESKARFVAPALAVMALRASTRREPRGMDHDADDSLGPRPAGNPVSFGLGGFFGWGLAGVAVSQIARPVGVALAAVGAARAVYGGVFAKGRDVTFPTDTMIQVQLAPAPVRAR